MKKKIGQSICIMMLFMILLSGCKPKYEGEEYEAVYTCEVVEDISQEENISFDKMVANFALSQAWIEDNEQIGATLYYLCFFENGTVYYMTESYKLDEYVSYFKNCNDLAWENMDECFYLGNLSNVELEKLERYLDDIDYNYELQHNFEEPRMEPCAEETILNGHNWDSINFRIIYGD